MIQKKIKELEEQFERIKYPIQTPQMSEIEAQLKVLREMDQKIQEAKNK